MRRTTVTEQISHNNSDWHCNRVNVELRDMRWDLCGGKTQLPPGIIPDQPSRTRPIGIFVTDNDDLVWRCYVENMHKAKRISKKLHDDTSFKALICLGFCRL